MIKVDRIWATIYGILIGDGCISRSGGNWFIVVTCSFYDDVEFFDYVVVPSMETIRGKTIRYRKRPKYGKVEINFSDKALFNKLNALGFPIGLKGEIEIPPSIPNRLWNHVIAGVFATDGSLVIVNNNGVAYPRVEFRSNSGRLVEQMRGWLEEKGIGGNVYCTKNKSGYKPTFRLEVPGKRNLLRFKEKVGFINPKHERKFNSFIDSCCA